MAYVSLYRKYRSQTFEEVMGQNHVTKTLQNAIKTGKVAHAYLFCGTRGTGKTTTARLLAKALNCAEGPTPIPCNKCSACLSITAGSTMDVLEMDAASHTGVDDIEEIRENVKFPPMELRYKVFIIDEVHQLSKSAKDAFLKTLEEPPSHTVFILATTEPQSIPITIRSRCQQFDFRRGSLKDIKDRLKFVAESEGVKVDDDALDLMSVNADGSYRDSLSLMEQIFAYTDGHVAVDDVNTVMGTVTHDFIVNLADTIADCDEAGAFEAAAEVMESGRDIQQILKSFTQHFRNLLYASVTNNLKDIATSKQMAERYQKQAARFSKIVLLKAVEILTEAEKDLRYSEQHRLLFEMSLLKIISLIKKPDDASIADAIQPIKNSQPVIGESVKAKESVIKHEKVDKQIIEEKKNIQSSEIIESTPVNMQKLPDFYKVEAKWSQVMQHLRSISNPAHAFLTNATPIDVVDGALVLNFRSEGLCNMFAEEKSKGKSPTKKQAVLTAIHRVFGVSNAEIICKFSPNTVNIAKKEIVSQNNNNEPIDSEENDVLADVLNLYDAEIVD